MQINRINRNGLIIIFFIYGCISIRAELTINKTKIDETGIRFPEASKESDALSTFFQLEKQERKIQRGIY